MHKYSHIIAPARLQNHILKNRITNSKSVPDPFDTVNIPSESVVEQMAGLARTGASIVTCAPGRFKDCESGGMFTSIYDMDDEKTRLAFTKMIERIHAYDSLACASTMIYFPANVSISDIHDWSVVPQEYMDGPESVFKGPGSKETWPEITKAQIDELVEKIANVCLKLRGVGFDMVNIYASYDASLLGKSLSPVFNQRTDEYGGSVENRVRLLKEICVEIKNKVGRTFPIEVQISGEEAVRGGFTIEDVVEYCKILEPYVDIFQLRCKTGNLHHMSNYFYEEENPLTLQYASALKNAGIKSLVASSGGWQNPDIIEKALAEGKCDLVSMARALFADGEFISKIIDGRGEDVTPCIRCDKCFRLECSVNPQMQNLGKDPFASPARSKKVAVIGGGPAGMRAAITAAERGHTVDLFEKSSSLGGQLRHADFVSCKWNILNYKNWLIRQCEKNGVNIMLNTEATAEMIGRGEYDAVFAGTGSSSRMDAVPLAPGAAPTGIIELFGNEKKLGRDVVVLGGTLSAVDAAIYLSENGHIVTMLSRSGIPGYDFRGHSMGAFQEAFFARPGISFIGKAQATLIESDGIRYTDGEGNEKKAFGDVVLNEGRTPNVDEAYAFAGLSPEFAVIGDANVLIDTSALMYRDPPASESPTTQANILHSTATAYAAAMKL